jgi:vitamin B12 transporter
MRRILMSLGILGGVVPVLAQNSQPPIFGEAIVVTASLESGSEKELPASVSVVDVREIAARQETEVAGVLATLPGVTVARSGSPGQVTSLFTRGTESDHTLVLWNGVELNNPYFGGFNWAFLPTEGVDRVEVVRGPFSSLYGGDAVGGAVQILSAATPGASLQVEAGEGSYRRGEVTAAGELGKARFDVAGHLRRGHGQVDNDFYDGESLMARVEWALRPGMTLGVLARGAEADTGIPFNSGQPSPQRTITWEETQIALPFRAEVGSWEVQAQLSRVTYDSAFRDPEDPFGFTASDTESESLRARSVATYHIHERSWLAFGSEWEEAEVDDRSVFGVALDGVSQSNAAVFGELFYSWGKLSVDAGLRHDDNDSFGAQTSPRFGTQLLLTPRTRLRASWGEAFRAPSLGELFYPLSGNPELQPETSESLEIGVQHQQGYWLMGLTAFETDLSNLIDFDFATFQNINVGRARSRGLEAEVNWSSERWALRWNATYLEAEDLESGEALLRRPEESSNLVLRYRHAPWSISVTGRYVGEREDVDPLTFERAVNDSFLHWDVAARWRSAGRLTPYARIENLTDEDYSEVLGYPAPGITLVAGLAVSYR